MTTPCIHVVGDSHSSLFTGLHGVCPTYDVARPQALDGLSVWHLGAYLAHSLTRDGHAARRRAREAIVRALQESAGSGRRSDRRLLAVFGEIDCRNHVVKRAMRGGPASKRAVQRVASDVAHRYADAMRNLAGKAFAGERLGFMEVPPATIAQHANTQQPTVGTFRQRSWAARAFNGALSGRCARFGAAILRTHDALANHRGEPNESWFADGVHADPRCLPIVLNELVRLGWLAPGAPAIAQARAMACVPPVAGDGMTHLPGGIRNDADARLVLCELAAARCRATGATSIAVVGAGRHTRAMGLEVFVRAGLRVEMVLDDAPSEQRMLGVPVVSMASMASSARAGSLPFQAVVVSSDAHEEALATRATGVLPRGVPIIPIYSWRTHQVAMDSLRSSAVPPAAGNGRVRARPSR